MLNLRAFWADQTEEEYQEQEAAWDTKFYHDGSQGLLHDYYGGENMPIAHLARECYQGVQIPAAELRRRLPETLRLAEIREREKGPRPYDPERMKVLLQAYVSFVDLCERMEKRSGQPVTILAC